MCELKELASFSPVHLKREEREELERMTREFLESGNTITQLDIQRSDYDGLTTNQRKTKEKYHKKESKQ